MEPPMNLTDDEIDALPAGREMDYLVGRYVMGPGDDLELEPGETCEVIRYGEESEWHRTHNLPGQGYTHAPAYSTDIAAAWQVVERMMVRHTQDFHFAYRMCDDTDWRFSFADKVDGVFSDCSGKAPTAPLAICRAALKAVNAKLAG